MTKETFEKAKDLIESISKLQSEIDSYNMALVRHTFKTAYGRDALMVRLDNGERESSTLLVPRELVITMLNSAVGKCQAEISKLQYKLDSL